MATENALYDPFDGSITHPKSMGSWCFMPQAPRHLPCCVPRVSAGASDEQSEPLEEPRALREEQKLQEKRFAAWPGALEAYSTA